MHMCWRYLLPIGAFLFLGTGIWVALVHGVVQRVVSLVLFGLAVGLFVWFVAKFVRTLREGPYEVYPSPFI